MRNSSKRFVPLLKAMLADLSLAKMNRDELVDLLADVVDEQVGAERNRCVRLCRDRAELWRGTSLSRSNIPSAVDEARNRANEATYLADLLESGE